MKIYQLHEYSGEYEDYRDRIIGSYFLRIRAEEEKAKAEAREEELIRHSKRCAKCPYIEYDASVSIDDLLVQYPDYCSVLKLQKGRYGIDCDNFSTHWDKATFEIVEAEVEE